LEVPKTKYKTLGDRALMFAAPKEWNALLSELRSLEDITVLKKQLKTLGIAYKDISANYVQRRI